MTCASSFMHVAAYLQTPCCAMQHTRSQPTVPVLSGSVLHTSGHLTCCCHDYLRSLCMTWMCVMQEIAREKAGIFKQGVPAFTVQQPVDALQSLLVSALYCNAQCRILTIRPGAVDPSALVYPKTSALLHKCPSCGENLNSEMPGDSKHAFFTLEKCFRSQVAHMSCASCSWRSQPRHTTWVAKAQHIQSYSTDCTPEGFVETLPTLCSAGGCSKGRSSPEAGCSF